MNTPKLVSHHLRPALKAGRCGKTLLLTVWLPLAGATHAQSGGGFNLGWSTIDAGGGASAGSGFTLTGTIGQPDAGTTTGSGFTLTGGFWSLSSTPPPPSAPDLNIRRAGASIVLTWPVAVTGFTLEYTTQLGSGVWLPEPTSVINTGTEHTVTVSAHATGRFYRLKN